MNDKVSEQISRLLEQFGGNAERVWPIMVQATQFDSLVAVIGGAILLLAGVVATAAWGWVGFAKHENADWDLAVAFGLILGAMSIVAGIALVMSSLSGVFYPEAALVARLLKR